MPRIPQWLLQGIVAMLCVPVLAHALPLPRNVQEKNLPPKEYDHPYGGELLLNRMTMEQIGIVCKRALAPARAPLLLGCAQLYTKMCRVMIATDEELSRYGWDYEIILRHEIGHCNGWVHNSPKDLKAWCTEDPYLWMCRNAAD